MATRSTRTGSFFQRPLLKDKEAPEYLREDSITTGYRHKLSYKACVFSWFWLHNETVNIWSHLLGFLFFFYFSVFMVFSPPQGSHYELVTLIIQLISYQACMLSSTLFHTFSCHSESAHNIWQETDHLGILCALFGTYISLISLTFSCFPAIRTLHMAVVVVIFCAVLLARYSYLLRVATALSADSPKIPLSTFLAVALYSIIPLSHWVWLHGGFFSTVVQETMRKILLPSMIGGIGLVFYVTRLPEKIFRAGSVDIVGSSHQVWHVMIFLGMAFWYHETSSTLLKDRHSLTSLCASGDAERHVAIEGDQHAPVDTLIQTLIKLVCLEELLCYFDVLLH